MVVTEADVDQRIVKELNAEPAAEEYSRAVGILDTKLDPFPGENERWLAAHAPDAQPAVTALVGGRDAILALAAAAPDGAEPDQTTLSPLAAVLRRLGRGLPGSTVYLGGTFTHVGAAARKNLAAVDATTGAVIGGFHAPALNAGVMAIAPGANGLYVGGAFTTVGSASRAYAAELDPGTGALMPGWAPVLDNYVRAIALTLDGSRVILGGDFNHLNGAWSISIGAVDPHANPVFVGDALAGDLAAAGTVALVIDDAHWADRASIEAIRYAARRIPSAPVMIVVGRPLAWAAPRAGCSMIS